MAAIVPSSGGTFTVSKLEEFFAGAIWLLQSLEADPARNPTAINYVTSSVNDDTQTMTASLSFKIQCTSDGSGNVVGECSDYLTTPQGGTAHWISGTGGTIKAATIQGAIFEAARLIDAKENQSSTNPLGYKNVTWSINNGDIGTLTSLLSISVTGFPLVSNVSNGIQTLKGKEYLS